MRVWRGLVAAASCPAGAVATCGQGSHVLPHASLPDVRGQAAHSALHELRPLSGRGHWDDTGTSFSPKRPPQPLGRTNGSSADTWHHREAVGWQGSTGRDTGGAMGDWRHLEELPGRAKLLYSLKPT